MAEFMMFMKGGGSDSGDWTTYIEKLIATGKFRGGSALANGVSLKRDAEGQCVVGGFMRFEADSIEDIKALLPDNPAFLSGNEIEISELIKNHNKLPHYVSHFGWHADVSFDDRKGILRIATHDGQLLHFLVSNGQLLDGPDL